MQDVGVAVHVLGDDVAHHLFELVRGALLPGTEVELGEDGGAQVVLGEFGEVLRDMDEIEPGPGRSLLRVPPRR